MCSPSIPQYQDKSHNTQDVTSYHSTTRSERSISVPVTLVSSDDALSCYSQISFDDDENMEQEVVDRWSPSSPRCHPISITLPPPQLLPMRESRWNATICKTNIDSPPMYYSIHRKRQRPAEMSCCALRDVPFRAPVRSSDSGEAPAFSTRIRRPKRLADSCTHRPNGHTRSNNAYDATSLERTIGFLDAALEMLSVMSDDPNEHYYG
jgi:hypothetical protein